MKRPSFIASFPPSPPARTLTSPRDQHIPPLDDTIDSMRQAIVGRPVDDLEVGDLADQRHHLLADRAEVEIPREGDGAAGYQQLRPAGKAIGEQAMQRATVLDADRADR